MANLAYQRTGDLQKAVQQLINNLASDSGPGTGAEAIGYTPPGTGTVGTTVAANLSQYVSVKDFGAVGNGSTDDTAAIQAAVNYVASLSGATLYFPSGNYKTTSTISSSGSFFGLFGSGAGGATIAPTFGNADIFSFSGNWISVDNFLFNSASGSFTSGYCINFSGNQGNYWINRLAINNGYRGIGFTGSAGTNTYITNSIISNLVHYGIYYSTTYTGLAYINNLRMQCTGGTSTHAGILIQSGDTFHFSNIDISGWYWGIFILPAASGFVRNFHGTNITCDGAGRVGSSQPSWQIDGSGASSDVSRIRLVNCWAGSTVGADGFYINQTNDVSLVNCIAINNGLNGIHILGSSSVGTKVDSCTVAGNSSSSSGIYSGIQVESGANEFYLRNNICTPVGSFVTNTQKYGINIAGPTNDYYIVSGNDTHGNITAGFNNGGTGAHTIVTPNL